MSYFKKYVALPEEKLRTLQNENSEKISRETVERIIQIALHLARVNGYNTLYEIKGMSGRYLTNTNVISLIEKIENEDLHLPGEEDFISLLSEAKVPLELIRNENIRDRIRNLEENGENNSPTYERLKGETTVSQSPVDVSTPKKTEIVKSKSTLQKPRKTKYHDFFITKKTITEERKKKPEKKRIKKVVKWFRK